MITKWLVTFVVINRFCFMEILINGQVAALKKGIQKL